MIEPRRLISSKNSTGNNEKHCRIKSPKKYEERRGVGGGMKYLDIVSLQDIDEFYYFGRVGA